MQTATQANLLIQVVILYFNLLLNVPVFDEIDKEEVLTGMPETASMSLPAAVQESLPTIAVPKLSPAPTVEEAIDKSEPEHSIVVPVQQGQELPRYFTRAEKQKRSDLSAAEIEQYSKVVRAILAQADLSTEDLEILKYIFPAEEINSIKILQTYNQAINNPVYSKQ